MSLRARLAAFVAAAVAVTVGLVTFAAYRSAENEAMASIDRFLKVRAPLAAVIDVAGRLDPEAMPRGEAGQVVGEDVIAQVILPDGSVVSLGSGTVVLPVVPRDLAVKDGSAPEWLRTEAIDGTNYRLLTRRAARGSALQVARDLTETEAFLAALRNRLLLIGVFGALLAGVGGWALAGRAIRPVQTLTGAAEHVAATGALDAAIPVESDDEVGRLAAAFNEMLARLETARAAQQRLVADASHELRTPLTSVRTNVELLARGGVPESDREAMLADLAAEVQELGSLVAELVDLATVGRDEEEVGRVDLGEVVSEVLERARRRATQEIRVSGQPVELEGRRAAVTRAIGNLVDNAVKWSPPDGVIEVSFDAATLMVRDRGPGFEPDDLPFVFKRFYRSAAARSMPGSGLGLAIVAAVAEQHGWQVVARNRAGGGAEVGIVFGES